MRHPSLDLRVEPVEVTVWADADRLAQVFGNLVDNASRATGGTGTVTLAMCLPAPDVVEIAVRDSGPGVPPADRERIFDRFVRLDSARDAARGGGGLGLSIARGIATAHGGALACVSSVPGATSGSEFVLTLPVLAPSIPSEERSTVGNIDAVHAFV
jgi:two-component system OmpR family sensor kinase